MADAEVDYIIEISSDEECPQAEVDISIEERPEFDDDYFDDIIAWAVKDEDSNGGDANDPNIVKHTKHPTLAEDSHQSNKPVGQEKEAQLKSNRLMTKADVAKIVVSKINIANADLAYGIDYDVDALTTELDEDHDMASGYKDDDMASGDEYDDMASGDETFDPMKMDVDSDHSVEDFECDTDDDEDDDGIKVKFETAVSKARQASDKLNKTDLTKQKANEASKPQIVKPASTPVEKKRAKVAEKPAPVAAVEKKFPANAAPKEKKAAKKKQRPVAVASPVFVKPKGRPAEKPAPVVAESPVQTRKTKFHKTLIANKIKKLGAKVGKAKRRR